jgi:cholesterol transport system auxiliary component
LSLVEFSHVFETPQKSAAVVEGVADVVDGKRRLLATRTLRAEVDAASADARGGAHALVAATDRLAEQRDTWLGRLEQGGDLESCGNR